MPAPSQNIDPKGQNKKNPDPESPPPKQQPQREPTPAKDKNDALKFEMTYANGGFNNGVEVKPDREGKVQLKISIYGGGEQNVMKIHPIPESIANLMKGYEVGADNNQDTPEITDELQRYFDEIRTILSAKIIDVLTEADGKISDAIRFTFEQVNRGY